MNGCPHQIDFVCTKCRYKRLSDRNDKLTTALRVIVVMATTHGGARPEEILKDCVKTAEAALETPMEKKTPSG